METQPTRSHARMAGIALIVIIIAIVIYALNSSSQLTSYHQKAYGFDIKYPSTWQIQDSLTPTSCCLFIVNVQVATTTAPNASGTPITTVTEKEPIRIQIGYYYKTATYDPFSMATTTKLTLGNNTAYTGTSKGTPFYLIPMSTQDGIGAAIFTSFDNTDATGTRATVEDILSSIKFTGTTTEMVDTKIGTSTATSTAY